MRSVFIKVAISLFSMAVIALPGKAQTGNPYQLTGSISAGGVVSGGSYQVGVAMGQPNAGEASGGSYTVGGGFFGGGQVAQPPLPPPQRLTYLPLLRR